MIKLWQLNDLRFKLDKQSELFLIQEMYINIFNQS